MKAEESARKYAVGLKQVRKAVRSGTAERVFYAADADPMVLEPLLQECADASVPCEQVQSMRILGARCGIAVGAAAAVLLLDI